jgi:GH18 family chitinase
VDYNWEYPGYTFGQGYNDAQTTKDYAGFNALLKETKTAFDAAGLLLTLAYYPDGKQENLLREGNPYTEP